MKKILKNFVFLTIPSLIILLLLLELFFRFIIPASEPPPGFFDENELIYKFDTTKEREGLFTIGKFALQRGHWKINNYGWISSINYVSQREKKKKLIALIGDSYIEALQVDVDKSYPSLLRKKIGDMYDVYSFGVSGAPLSEYLNYSRYVNRHFNPDILIFNLVHNDFDESIFQLNRLDTHILLLDINDSIIIEKPPKPNYSFLQKNWKKKIIKKSALCRYLYINLHIKKAINTFSKRKNNEVNANVKVEKLIKNKNLIIKSVDYILGKIREENPEKRIIFTMDAPRDDIYNDNLKNSNILFLHDFLKKYCLKYDFEYIDFTKSMANDYKVNQIRFNSEFDGHWNEYGHNFVSEQMREYLTNSNFNLSGKQKTYTDN